MLTPLDLKEASRRRRARRYDARVLVVDDNDANLMVARLMLEQYGCTVELATGGEIAIDLARSRPFDLVFMDEHMPLMDGCEATRQIRAGSSATAEAPILGLTADVSRATCAMCLDAGMNAVLAKPMRERDLEEALVRWIGGKTHDEPAKRPAAPLPIVGQDTPDGDDESPALDPERFEALATLAKASGKIDFPDMVDKFVGNASRQVAVLCAATRDGDRAALKQAAHTLKGTAGSYGANGLSRMAAQIENALRDEDAPIRPPCLGLEMQRVRAAAKKLLDEGPG